LAAHLRPPAAPASFLRPCPGPRSMAGLAPRRRVGASAAQEVAASAGPKLKKLKEKRRLSAEAPSTEEVTASAAGAPKKKPRLSAKAAGEYRAAPAKSSEAPVTSSELAIWAADVALPEPRQTPKGAAGRASLREARRWTPQEEHKRISAMKGLRSKMVRLKTEHSGVGSQKPNVLTFERWLARFALRRDSAKFEEPVIPADGVVDAALVRDLERVMSTEAATSIAQALATEAERSAARLSGLPPSTAGSAEQQGAAIRACVKRIRALALKARRKTPPAPKGKGVVAEGEAEVLRELAAEAGKLRSVAASAAAAAAAAAGDVPSPSSGSTASLRIDASRQRGTVDVSLDGAKPYLSISSAHYDKMQRLFARHAGLGPVDEASFHERLFCCLARYEALKGAGYQCAVPGRAFDALRPSLGEVVECFASPLNCHYDRFCSAFGPLEEAFGSLGSFFDFEPLEGSFEANPPFVPEIMDAMLEHIEALLGDASRGPLSFLIVIPAWGAGVGTVKHMEKSRHCRASSRIEASSHGFCDGAQHLDGTRELYRPSSWDTAVSLLQNAAGAKRWPLSKEELDKTFGAAMKEVVKGGPSLDQWENRGQWMGGSAKRKWTPQEGGGGW